MKKSKYGYTTQNYLPEEAIVKALEKSGGIMAKAARMLGVTRAAISRRVRRSARLQEKLIECKETRLDVAESVLDELVREKNLGAVCFQLKCLGKERGYVENQFFGDSSSGGALGDFASSLVRLGAQLQRELESRQIPSLEDEKNGQPAIDIIDIPELPLSEDFDEDEDENCIDDDR